MRSRTPREGSRQGKGGFLSCLCGWMGDLCVEGERRDHRLGGGGSLGVVEKV